MFEYVLFKWCSAPRIIFRDLVGSKYNRAYKKFCVEASSFFCTLYCYVIDLSAVGGKKKERFQKYNIAVKDKLSPNLVDVFLVLFF